MIKASELRIGNWFLGLAKPQQIEGCDLYIAKDGYILAGEPIPLTPEILEKAGFIESVFVDSDGDDRSCYKHDNLKDFYFNDSLEFDHVYIMVNQIKYLHQLQNLYFALTGEELTIEL